MRKVFVKSAVSITCLDTFLKENLEEVKKSVFVEKKLVEPNYKDYIAPAMIRRSSKVMKMSLASSQACMEGTDAEDLGAIIVGSGLGCLMDTEKFLHSSITAESDSLIPPLAFIQSGHNAVSGQIALQLKNQQYNMTHVQKGLSFEYSLLDAVLRIKEGNKAVMLGAVDEYIVHLDELAQRMAWPDELREQLSEGCSFFVLSEEETDAAIEVLEVKTVQTQNLIDELDTLLAGHSLTFESSLSNFVGFNELPVVDLEFPHQVYTEWVGRYFTSSAFGFHLAYDTLKNRGKSGDFCTVLNFSDAQFSSIVVLRRV
ncbi:beta-ketoacyl synthase chain length factor [Reichenbachiella agarivorans]|uniref:Beta-ketoacyl synthase chain length factor n=1 Tax=Reichenbachiella agarivorans TaxID=2979464 RepID=A0ABY6CJS1_9BACT|nr:beta-ketoacyl synthase chain length factor [Reichenbachiella agarivorans]UXP30771.1 beta-ketoacyl synthase chain length factor [Reichenbachiella agarivorans]